MRNSECSCISRALLILLGLAYMPEVGLAVGGATALCVSLPPWAGLGTGWWRWRTHEGEGKRNCTSALSASCITFADISLTEGYMADSKSKRENVAKLHSKR